MLSGFFAAELRRLCRNLILLGIVLFAAGLAWGAFSHRAVLDRVSGSTPLSEAALNNGPTGVEEMGPLWRVDAVKAVDSGVVARERREGEPPAASKRTAEFRFVPVGNQVLSVRVLPGANLPLYEGRLVKMPAGLEEHLVRSAHRLDLGTLSPFLLDATPHARLNPLLLLPSLVLFALGVFCVARGFYRAQHPQSHPLFKTLGNAPLEVALPGVEKALDEGWSLRTPLQIGGGSGSGWTLEGRFKQKSQLRIGQGWFYYANVFQGFLFPLKDLIWAYGHNVSHRVNGVPTGTSHHLKLHFRSGKVLTIPTGHTPPKLLAGALRGTGLGSTITGEGGRDEILAAMHEYAPWAIFGFSDSAANDWKRGASRGEMVAAVDHRRSELGA